mmetsp:Transcript_60079/g.140542  ORF Transcript_60079/g.140542 Transcript_60079/m.140542 type:complete len:96 (+) Transcript_60079:1048-1335(+)
MTGGSKAGYIKVDAENGPGTSSHSHALPDLDDLDLTGAEKIFANEVDEWDQSDEVWDIRRPAKDQQSTPEEATTSTSPLRAGRPQENPRRCCAVQ